MKNEEITYRYINGILRPYIGEKTSHENNEREILFERNCEIIITKVLENGYEGKL